MDFGKAFSFVFEDEDWIKKIGIGALLSLTVIGLIPVLGWALEITKRVINKDAEVLPDWSDFGGYITRGFLTFVIVFVYIQVQADLALPEYMSKIVSEGIINEDPF